MPQTVFTPAGASRRQLLMGAVASAALAGVAGCAKPAEPAAAAAPVPPVAPKIPKTIEQLGRVRVDNYAWMKDERWQEVLKDPTLLREDIRTHLVAENAYADAMMAPTKALQDKLVAEMKGRIKQDDSSVPEADGPWQYYRRFAPEAQQPVHARQPRGGGAETVLLDADALATAAKAAGAEFFRVGQTGHSPDHSLFAYAVDEQGSEVWTLKVKDIATGEDLPGPVMDCYGEFSWSPDSRHLFWVWRDDNGRPAKIFRRPARGGDGSDVLVYEEKDEGKFISVGHTESRQFMMIFVGDQETSEYWTIPAATPEAAPTLFSPRETGVLYSPVHFDGRWYVLTNADDAVDFKVMTAEPGRTARKDWKPFIDHTPGRFIESLSAFENHLVRQERVNALPRIVIRARKGGAEHAIELTEQAYSIGYSVGLEYASTILRYTYESPTTPAQWFDYDMAARTRELRKTQEVPSGHDPAKYAAERFFAKAPDGQEVPVTVLRLSTAKLDASEPVLLYGYGSYGIVIDADFDLRMLSLVDRGWIVAYAHVRGGADKGFGWFQDGRKFKKTNTFTDFIAVAEDLVARKYAARGRIVSMGRSAGGLLVGAVASLAPDGLFGGHVAGVPFVDVLNTMSDASLPLTPPEWPEWGDPLTSVEAYDYIASYSPYDIISDRPYPPILATGGLSDPRVTYWEPSKFVAKLRELAPKAGPFLLDIDMEAGHMGGGGRFERLNDYARDFAFAMKALGEAEAGGPFPR